MIPSKVSFNLSMTLTLLLAFHSGFLNAQEQNQEAFVYQCVQRVPGVCIRDVKSGEVRVWRDNVYPGSVSRNGKRIAYIHLNELFTGDLNFMNRFKPGIENLGQFDHLYVASWSPVDDQIAVISWPDKILRIFQPDGTPLQTFAGLFTATGTPTHTLSWSPDGTKIAYETTVTIDLADCPPRIFHCETKDHIDGVRTIGVLDLNTGETTIPYIPNGEFYQRANGSTARRWHYIDHPVWSPKSDRIAVRKIDLGIISGPGTYFSGRNVGIISASGSSEVTLVTSDFITPELGLNGLNQTRNTPMSWSPDGTRLAYVKVGEHTLRGHPDDNIPRETMGIYVSNLNGLGDKVSDVITEHLQWVILNQSGVRVDISIEQERIRIGDKIDCFINITSYEDEPRTILLDLPILTETEIDPEKRILQIDEETDPIEPFVLTKENPARSFYVPIIALKAGVAELEAEVTVVNEDNGVTEELKAQEDISVSPFEIEISTTPHQLVLNQTEDAEKSPDCIELENSPDVNNCLEITVTIKNISDQKIDGVKLEGAKKVTDIINSRDFENLGVPLTQLKFTPPAGTDLEPLPVDLEASGTPGSETTYIWNVNATEAPSILELEALVIGSIGGKQVQGFQEEDIDILDKIILKWGIKKDETTRTQFLSGAAVRVDGFIENVTKEAEGGNEGVGKDLLVLVYPKHKGNLGGGFMQHATVGESADEYQFFYVPSEGDNQRMNIVGTFHSLPTVGHTTGHIEYGVRVWIIEDDDSLINADSQAKLDDKNGFVSEYDVRFNANNPNPDTWRQDCIDDGNYIWLCGFTDGFVNDFGPAMYGLWQYADDVKERMWAHKIFLMKTGFEALMGDPDKLALFFQTIYDKYVERVNLGVMGIKGFPMAFEQFSITGAGAISEFLFAVENRDMIAVQEKVGFFFGANPDLLLEPFIMGKSFIKMWKQLRKTAGEVGEFTAYRAMRQNAMRQQASIGERLAAGRADPNVTNLATVLKAGDGLSDDVLREVYGVSTRMRKILQFIADDLEVILSFRSRDPRASALIEAIPPKAYPKPQALKFKCTNDIDVTYLGYPPSAAPKVHIVEPPPGFAGKTGNALEAQLDLYMDRLKAIHPDLHTNGVLADEVRKRLKTRTKEWNKLVPELDLDSTKVTSTTVDTSFGHDAQHVIKDGVEEVGVKSSRDIIQKPAGTIQDKVSPDSTRRMWDIEMSGPNGNLPVAGDIDFLAIFDKDGFMIRDPDKRKAVYEALSHFADMQHGESFTFRIQEVRKEYLRCCTEGGEAMVTIGPGKAQTPTAGFFVDNLSIMRGGPNQSFLKPRPVEVKGLGIVEKAPNGDPTGIILRRENPDGEFVLINGSAPLSNIERHIVLTHVPAIWDNLIDEFLQRLPFYFPTFLGREILFEVTGQGGGGDLEDQEITFTQDGPIVQAGRVEEGLVVRDSRKLRVWTEADSWQNATPEEVITLGNPNLPDMAPMTSCPNGAAAGDHQIHITTQVELETDGIFFTVGDRVVLNPGFENEEYLVILETPAPDELLFTSDFQFTHKPGEIIVCLGPFTGNEDVKFLRGDCNIDGNLDIADAVTNLTYQFIGTVTPICFDACDFDDSGALDVSDPIASLSYQFLGTSPPAAPGINACGIDVTADELTCKSFENCTD